MSIWIYKYTESKDTGECVQYSFVHEDVNYRERNVLFLLTAVHGLKRAALISISFYLWGFFLATVLVLWLLCSLISNVIKFTKCQRIVPVTLQTDTQALILPTQKVWGFQKHLSLWVTNLRRKYLTLQFYCFQKATDLSSKTSPPHTAHRHKAGLGYE